MDKPIVLSIITAVYNRVDMVGFAIESVMNQWQGGIEHIIIDGGSTDGTREVIKQYPHLRVFSEPDRGIYDAWNKGIKQARGEWLCFLNSDDCIESGSLAMVINQLVDPNDIAIFNARVVKKVDEGDITEIKRYQAKKIGNYLENILSGGPAINSWIIRKSVFLDIGDFNTSYKIASDIDFCVRASLSSKNIYAVNQDYYNYQFHPGSATFNDELSSKYECQIENLQVARDVLNRLEKNHKDYEHIQNWLLDTSKHLVRNSLILKKHWQTALEYIKIGNQYDRLFIPKSIQSYLKNVVSKKPQC